MLRIKDNVNTIVWYKIDVNGIAFTRCNIGYVNVRVSLLYIIKYVMSHYIVILDE